MYNLYGRCMIVPMHSDIDGKGPELDPDKICTYSWEIWDELFTTIAEFSTEHAARQALDQINEAINLYES